MSRKKPSKFSVDRNRQKNKQEAVYNSGRLKILATYTDHGIWPLMLPGRKNPQPLIPQFKDDFQNIQKRKQNPFSFQNPEHSLLQR